MRVIQGLRYTGSQIVEIFRFRPVNLDWQEDGTLLIVGKNRAGQYNATRVLPTVGFDLYDAQLVQDATIAFPIQ